MTGGVSCPKSTYKKPKPEKVQKIRLQDAKECWVCNTTQNLQEHHCFGGSLRQKSERYGLTIYLCMRHHTGVEAGDKGIHFNPRLRDFVQRKAQRKFEEIYGYDLFMQEFGRSYL